MAKKASAYLKEENLLTLLSQNNFIVPEIQREYVWGENEGVITKFLSDLKNKIGVCCNECNLPSSENKINIGFLYSYKPDYVKIEHDRFLDENLIDGQQRFTTLFLLLFYCALKETRADGKNRKEEFLTLIRFEEKIRMCFDFRVRDLTKRFMLELIEKVDSIDQIQNIDKQTWFLKDYKNDVSIKSIRNALGFIQSIFSDNTKYYNHIINYVVFWHFKTEATSQGEELYITMNARGEELADNEVTKAALMVGGSEIYEWGKKWEEWQQFFWENRDKNDPNPSADKGFNGFLYCVAGLESYLNYDNWENAEKDIQKLLTLEKVEKYITAFKLVIAKRSEFEKQYSYSDWIQNCFNEIWGIINKSETDWMVDYRDKNKSTERNRMVFIWSWLYYITEASRQGKTIQINELYRILRFFYVRYNNFNRSVTTLKKTLDLILINGIWDSLDNEMGNEIENPEEETDTKFRTKEETIKNTFLQLKSTGNDLFKIEELIWQIEDHPLNLDGRDAKAINCSHLIDFVKTPNLDELKLIKEKFYELFPVKNDGKVDELNWKQLINILIFYGNFWERQSPWYCWNFFFANWKKIIRNIDTKSNVFKDFFEDFTTKSLEDIYKEKVVIFDADFNTSDFSVHLKWYAAKLENKLWNQGYYIVFEHYNYTKNDSYFINTRQLLNTKGDFKGGNPQILSELIL